ncbi:hypothetical protein ACHAXT_010797 [Thalassiosira profunda]
MNYVAVETTAISTRRDLGGNDDALIGAIWAPTSVNVDNARRLQGSDKQLSLNCNGFEMKTTTSTEELEAFRGMDYCDQDRVVGEYYPTCEKLVADAIVSQTSANASSPPIACACAFDHNVRSSQKASVGTIRSKQSEEDGNEGVSNVAAPQVQNPAGLVHADYTKVSAPKRLEQLSQPPKMNDVLRPTLLAQKRSSLLDPTMVQEALEGKRRYAFINVWRSIDPEHPVKNPPLACIDANSVTADELRTFQIHYVDRVGENYFACHPPVSTDRKHEWWYYPDMTMDEALLLKQWDSRGEMARGAQSDAGGLSTFTIHSAFLDPSFDEGCPPRKSIEVRCVVIWEKEE